MRLLGLALLVLSTISLCLPSEADSYRYKKYGFYKEPYVHLQVQQNPGYYYHPQQGYYQQAPHYSYAQQPNYYTQQPNYYYPQSSGYYYSQQTQPAAYANGSPPKSTNLIYHQAPGEVTGYDKDITVCKEGLVNKVKTFFVGDCPNGCGNDLSEDRRDDYSDYEFDNFEGEYLYYKD